MLKCFYVPSERFTVYDLVQVFDPGVTDSRHEQLSHL